MVFLLLTSASCLSGCLGSGSGSLGYDPAVHNAPGTITIGGAKVYSRETLINERAADIAWIDRLISASEDPAKVSFKPTLIREMEEISALSATLGVRYDPTSGLASKRANERGEIQQDIDVLKAKVALSQLRRDVELVASRFPTQNEPVNAGLGSIATGGAIAAPPSLTPPEATQVATTINALIANATARLDAEAKPIGRTEVVSSPADDFRDRLAYRDMLKAARNAAGLDELHDAGSNRLVRLNLRATVLPDPKYVRALGAVQVKIADSAAGAPARRLLDWLRTANGRSEWRVDAANFRSNGNLDALENSGDFVRTKIGGFQTLMPMLESATGADLNPQNLIDRASWTRDAQADRTYFGQMLAKLSVGGAELDSTLADLCRPGSPLSLALDIADARTSSYALVRSANLSASDLGIPQPVTDAGSKAETAANYQQQVIALIKDRPDCADTMAEYQGGPSTWRLLRRPEFAAEQQIRIYEVGPREQAQQVSTLARSARSLSTAVALAAAAPQVGVAGSLDAGFRRDLMNRASSLDRVPEVVGYSVGGRNIFGWVIGPHATTDAKGRAQVRQVSKSYDLAVDLSVPSWWSMMNLEVTTVWAPSPHQLTEGSLAVTRKGRDAAAAPVVLPVQLTSAATADQQAFTQFLVGNSRRQVDIQEVVGGPVNGCTATTST